MSGLERKGWLEVAEGGTAAGVWFLVVLSTAAGRRPARAFLRLLAPYYLLAARDARRASRRYLELVHGRATLPMIHDHLLRFAQCALDRLFFIRGRSELFDVRSHGEEHLRRLVEQKQGALLIGAHLGSFEAMQRMADARSIPINVVGYFRNARMVNAILERLDPGGNARLLEIEPESMQFVLEIRERLERGELVALLADRVMPGGRSAEVEFLGQPATFPTGPYLLASVLRCPVYLVFALHRPPDRYDLYCEPFAERIELPRRGREAALVELAGRFARRLEHYCRLAPDNWFNFYDFWSDREETSEGNGQ